MHNRESIGVGSGSIVFGLSSSPRGPIWELFAWFSVVAFLLGWPSCWFWVRARLGHGYGNASILSERETFPFRRPQGLQMRTSPGRFSIA